MLEVEFSNKARSFLRKTEKTIEERIASKIEELRIDPFPKGIEKIKGEEGKAYRIRVGDYRIIYDVQFEINKLLIVKVGKRENIYD